MRAVLHATVLGMLAPACVLLTPGSAQAADVKTVTTTSGAERSCWLPENDLTVDYCGDVIVYAGADENRVRVRGLLEFGFGPGSMPEGATVLDAELHLYQDGTRSSGSAQTAQYGLYR